jgi:hypothetical protein
MGGRDAGDVQLSLVPAEITTSSPADLTHYLTVSGSLFVTRKDQTNKPSAENIYILHIYIRYKVTSEHKFLLSMHPPSAIPDFRGKEEKRIGIEK